MSPLFACIKLLKNARAVFRPVLLGKKDREQYPTSPNKRGTGDLWAFADIDEQADDMFFRLVEQLAEKEGVTERLKADNQMLWVKRMNNIRNRANEIISSELIYVKVHRAKLVHSIFARCTFCTPN